MEANSIPTFYGKDIAHWNGGLSLHGESPLQRLASGPTILPVEEPHRDAHPLRAHSAAVQLARAQLGWERACTDWQELVESPLIRRCGHQHSERQSCGDCDRRRAKREARALRKTAGAECEAGPGDAGRRAEIQNCPHGLPQLPPHSGDGFGEEADQRGGAGADLPLPGTVCAGLDCGSGFPARMAPAKEPERQRAHGDINSHILDLGRFLVGEFKEVCGLLHTFIPERPLAEAGGRAPSLPGKAPRKMGKVTVDDTSMFLGRFENGALANLEATRLAPGRKNRIEIEVNGGKGSLYFDFEDMNRLKWFDTASASDRQGFRDILVTQQGGVHPYVGQWWPPGHILGYEHTFVHTIADFVTACVEGKPVRPNFEDGLENQRVLEAVEESSKSGRWVKVRR